MNKLVKILKELLKDTKNEKNMQENKNTYRQLVEATRELARHALRSRNVRAQMESIGSYEKNKTDDKNSKAEVVKLAEENLQYAKYEFNKHNHAVEMGMPTTDETKKYHENCISEAEKNLEKAKKDSDEANNETSDYQKNLNECIAKCNEKIEKWETGENKVQLDNLNELAREYLEKALNEKARQLVNLVQN